jgi:hypothetical protein
MKAIFRNQCGLSLVLVLMVVAILLSLTGAGFLFSSLNLKSASNLKTGSAALHVADAGIQHALAVISSGGDYDSLLQGTDPDFPLVSGKPTLSGSLSNPGVSYTYTVVAENDTTVPGETATNDSNRIITLTSTATGPNGSKRKVKAYIGRSPWIPPGAIYLPGTPANVPTSFNGNSFATTGNDTNPNGTAGSLAAIPALATNNAAQTTAISGPSGTLSSGQYNQVTGQGSNPSVVTSTNLDVNQLAENLINLGADLQTYGGGTFKASDGGLGTSTQPKITHITGNARLTCGNGKTANAMGYGILIVDGDLDITGLFKFEGLVIARGEQQSLAGNGSKISGALLIKESTTSGGGQDGLTVGGNSGVNYSSQTLQTVFDRWGNAFSTNARIIAWHEMMV